MFPFFADVLLGIRLHNSQRARVQDPFADVHFVLCCLTLTRLLMKNICFIPILFQFTPMFYCISLSNRLYFYNLPLFSASPHISSWSLTVLLPLFYEHVSWFLKFIADQLVPFPGHLSNRSAIFRNPEWFYRLEEWRNTVFQLGEDFGLAEKSEKCKKTGKYVIFQLTWFYNFFQFSFDFFDFEFSFFFILRELKFVKNSFYVSKL